MSSQSLLRIPALAGTVILCLAGWASGAAMAQSLSPLAEQARYAPIQAITYEIGSKAVSGYFLTQADTCFVTLMVIEKSDPDAPLAQSAARVRLMLHPGQVAGLDSEEGRSLNFTCSEDATALLVEVGERDRLVAQQATQHGRLTAEWQPRGAGAITAK